MGIPQLFGHIAGAGTAHLDPCLTEESAGRQDENEVENGVEGIVNNLGKGCGGRDVVGDTSDGDGGSSSLAILPFTQNSDQYVGGGAVVQELGYKVKIGNQCRLEDDGHVGSVEKFDGIGTLLSAILLILDGKDDPPSLEVDDHHKYEEGGGKVGQVGEILTKHGLLDGANLVIPRNQQMKECNNGTLELGTPPSIDGGRTECLPDNILANVGGNEETDTAPQPVSLLEQLVQRQHDQSRAK